MQSVCHTHLSTVSVFFACCSPFSLASGACFSVLPGSLRTKCCVDSHQPCEWSCSTWSTLHVFLWLPWEQCFNLSDVQQMLRNSIALKVYKSFHQSYIHQSYPFLLCPTHCPTPGLSYATLGRAVRWCHRLWDRSSPFWTTCSLLLPQGAYE